MRKIELKAWETVIIAVSVVTFLSASFLYFTGFPIRKYLFGLHEEGGQNKIGVILEKSGSLRRELLGEEEFKALGKNASIFNQDTIVTGTDGVATLALDGGGVIKLDPNTMIRLEFETQITWGGISRAASVNVITGKVTGRAAEKKIIIKTKERIVQIPKNSSESIKSSGTAVTVDSSDRHKISYPTHFPTFSPSPSLAPSSTPSVLYANRRITGVKLIAPANGAKLFVDKDSPQAEKLVGFEWSIVPKNSRALLTVTDLRSKTAVFRDVVEAGNQGGKTRWLARSPGTFEWELSEPTGEPIEAGKNQKFRFSIGPGFEAIQLLEPLIGGQEANSNLLRGKRLEAFDMKFRWKPYPGATQYQLLISNSENFKNPVVQRTLASTDFVLKPRIYSGKVYSKVAAVLASGFIVTSPVKSFTFNFLPPILVTPLDHSTVARKSLAEGNGIVLTWQKTNFTDSYELQISEDPGFKKGIRVTLKENFYVVKSPRVGKYFWRVKSISGSYSSTESKPFEVTVQP